MYDVLGLDALMGSLGAGKLQNGTRYVIAHNGRAYDHWGRPVAVSAARPAPEVKAARDAAGNIVGHGAVLTSVYPEIAADDAWLRSF